MKKDKPKKTNGNEYVRGSAPSYEPTPEERRLRDKSAMVSWDGGKTFEYLYPELQ